MQIIVQVDKKKMILKKNVENITNLKKYITLGDIAGDARSRIDASRWSGCERGSEEENAGDEKLLDRFALIVSVVFHSCKKKKNIVTSPKKKNH